MKGEEWAFKTAVDRQFFNVNPVQVINVVTSSINRQIADKIVDILQTGETLCIQRSETMTHNDNYRMMVIFSAKIGVWPLVLCRECKHYNTEGCADGFGWCDLDGAGHGTTDEWFCAGGKRDGGADNDLSPQ